MAARTFSSIGTTTKKERLILNDRIDCRAVLIFISEYPYAGYYGTTVPDKDEPKSMFLVTDTNYDDEKVIRAIQSVKSHFKHFFDAVPGTIKFLNYNMGMIRFRNISCKQIPELIKAFKDEGIKFMSHHNFHPFDGIIRVTKYFNTEEVEEGILIDIDNPDHAYLHIERKLTWETFESIYRDVRNNMTGFTFDAALATMYNERGVLDFIRIYDEKRSVEKLRTLYKKFKDIMARH
ncbi:MAG: hypothetical protein JW965_10165 [Bacteroidales bacterium]|nr:hypothetical protein [Bacteroidales bacterium]